MPPGNFFVAVAAASPAAQLLQDSPPAAALFERPFDRASVAVLDRIGELLQVRSVRRRYVRGSDALHRRFELVEQRLVDLRRDLGTDADVAPALLDDDGAPITGTLRNARR